MLTLDINIVFTILNILILFALVKIFLFKPVHKILDARAAEIDKQYSDAQAAENEANEIKNKYEESFSNIAEEKNAIITEARNKANDEYDRIVADANKEAEKIKTEAKKSAELKQAQYMQQAKDQIADLVVAATAKLVCEHQNEETDKALYNEFIAKTGEQ